MICVSVLATTESYAKTAEPIEVPFGKLIRLCPRKHVLDGVQYGRHLASTTERLAVPSTWCAIQMRFIDCLQFSGLGFVTLGAFHCA